MNAINAVREIMRKNSITLKSLGEALGLPQRTIQARLDLKRNSSPSINPLLAMCRQLGYKIVILPAAVRTPGYELDDGMEE